MTIAALAAFVAPFCAVKINSPASFSTCFAPRQLLLRCSN
jgi:hypothetical protein